MQLALGASLSYSSLNPKGNLQLRRAAYSIVIVSLGASKEPMLLLGSGWLLFLARAWGALTRDGLLAEALVEASDWFNTVNYWTEGVAWTHVGVSFVLLTGSEGLRLSWDEPMSNSESEHF